MAQQCNHSDAKHSPSQNLVQFGLQLVKYGRTATDLVLDLLFGLQLFKSGSIWFTTGQFGLQLSQFGLQVVQLGSAIP